MLIRTNLGGNDRTFQVSVPSKELDAFYIFLDCLIQEYDSYFIKTRSRRNKIRNKLLDYCVNHNLELQDYKKEFSNHIE